MIIYNYFIFVTNNITKVDKNCCIFTETLCTLSGVYVVARMKLVEGVLSIVYYDMNGVVYTNNDIVFPSCVTNFINAVIDIIQVNCNNNEDTLRVSLTFSTLTGLQNGTIIKLTSLSNNNELIQTAFVGGPIGAFAVTSTNGTDIEIKIVDISLMTSAIGFGVTFEDIGCAISNIYTVSIIDIINALPSWGLGITSQDTIIKP